MTAKGIKFETMTAAQLEAVIAQAEEQLAWRRDDCGFCDQPAKRRVKTVKAANPTLVERRAATDGKCGLCGEPLPSTWYGLCTKCNTERTRVLFEGNAKAHMSELRELNARALRTGDWTCPATS